MRRYIQKLVAMLSAFFIILASVSSAHADAERPATVEFDRVKIEELLHNELPKEAEPLLEELSVISKGSEQVSQNVLAAEEEIKRLEDQIRRNDESIRVLTEQGMRSQGIIEQSRVGLNKVSQAKYRGSVIDSVSAVFGAQNPQSAIDRSSYMNAFNQRSQNDMSALLENLDTLATTQQALYQAKATNLFSLELVHDLVQQLENDSQLLRSLQDKIMSAVDELPLDQKELWVEKNGPISVDIDTFLERVSGAAAAAMTRLGMPYSWGATGPDAFDCSGLMLWAYQQLGKSIPRTSQAQLSGGTPVALSDLRPGDIIGYYPGVTHVGMYIGNGQIVHASDYGIPVQVVAYDSMPIQGAVRY